MYEQGLNLAPSIYKEPPTRWFHLVREAAGNDPEKIPRYYKLPLEDVLCCIDARRRVEAARSGALGGFSGGGSHGEGDG